MPDPIEFPKGREYTVVLERLAKAVEHLPRAEAIGLLELVKGEIVKSVLEESR
jgi:hypothetical protein